MATPRRFIRRIGWCGLAAMLLALVVAPLAAYPADQELQRSSTIAYHDVVKDRPYAPYTTADEFKRTSTVAYYSVVKDKPFAPYTTADEFKRTSTVAYYSVLH